MNTENPVGRAVFVAERNLVDGVFRAGWFRVTHFPYVSREFWRAGTQDCEGFIHAVTTIGISVSSRCERDLVFAGAEAYDGLHTGVSTLSIIRLYFALRDVCLIARRRTYTDVLRHEGCIRGQTAGHIFGNHDVHGSRARKDFRRELENGVCSDAYATRDSAIYMAMKWHAGRRRSRQPARLPWRCFFFFCLVNFFTIDFYDYSIRRGVSVLISVFEQFRYKYFFVICFQFFYCSFFSFNLSVFSFFL